jgi:hypothetical protein
MTSPVPIKNIKFDIRANQPSIAAPRSEEYVLTGVKKPKYAPIGRKTNDPEELRIEDNYSVDEVHVKPSLNESPLRPIVKADSRNIQNSIMHPSLKLTGTPNLMESATNILSRKHPSKLQPLHLDLHSAKNPVYSTLAFATI